MLKKVIAYTGYDDMPHEKTAYFNLTKTEFLDLDREFKEKYGTGLYETYKTIYSEEKDLVSKGEIPHRMLSFIRLLIERAYGVRPVDDPDDFVKEDENGQPYWKKFKRSAAYDAYVTELISGEEAINEFYEHALPKFSEAQRAEAEKLLAKEGIELPSVGGLTAKDA